MAIKSCLICCTEVSALRKSPTTCAKDHDDSERACHECWEVHLSKEVEEKAPMQVECLFCPSIISRQDLARLARKGTVLRYDAMCLQEMTHFLCNVRCTASKEDPAQRDSPCKLQPHDRANDGRVFACNFCGFRYCIDCDRPEHENETCDQYQARVVHDPEHARNNELSKAALDDYEHCPSCSTAYMKEGGCGFMTCGTCKFRFCGGCDIPWVGDGSSYLAGKAAHGEHCKYRTRDAPSAHGLHNRFSESGEVEARLAAKREAKREKHEAGMRAKEEAKGLERESEIGAKRGGKKGTPEMETEAADRPEVHREAKTPGRKRAKGVKREAQTQLTMGTKKIKLEVKDEY